MANSDNSISQRILSAFSSRVVVILVGALYTPILIRILEKSEYGRYALIISLFGIATSIVDGGFFDGTRKFIAESRDDDDWQSRVYAFYMQLGVVTATVFVCGLLVAQYTGLTAAVLDIEGAVLVYALVVMIFGRQLFLITRGGLIALGAESISEPLRSVRKAGMAAIAIGLTYSGWKAEGALLGHVVSEWVVFVVGIALISRHIDLRLLLKPVTNQFPWRELLRFSLQSTVLSVLLATVFNIDILFVQNILGEEQTAIYKSSTVVLSFLNILPLSISTVFVSESSNLWDKEEKGSVESTLAQIIKYNFLVALLLAIGMWVLAEEFVWFYLGQDYASAAGVITLLLPGGVFLATAHPLIATNQGIDKLKPIILAVLVGAVTNILLNPLLIDEIGVEGAAIATSVSYGIMVLGAVLALRYTGIDPLPKKQVALIFGSGIVVAALLQVVGSQLPRIASLIIVPPLGLIVYVLILINAGVLDRDRTYEIIMNILQKIQRND